MNKLLNIIIITNEFIGVLTFIIHYIYIYTHKWQGVYEKFLENVLNFFGFLSEQIKSLCVKVRCTFACVGSD